MSTFRTYAGISGQDVTVSIDMDPWMRYAIDQIRNDYGDDVSIEKKLKSLLKFGRNPSVGNSSSGYTLWYTGQDQANETYVAANTNSIDSVSSNNTNDTTAVTIEGHTESGGNKTFVVQTVTLQGTTRVPLTTALNRLTRMYNSGATAFVGEIYGYQNTALTTGKPNDTTKIHITIPAGKQQSQKASTSLSSIDYWIVTGFYASVLEKASAFADVALQVRESGGVFREREDIAVTNSNNAIFEFKPYLVVPKNSDVRLVAVSDSTSRDISGSIQGVLAKIV